MDVVKSKTKYVYCENGYRYKILQILKPNIIDTILICEEVETNQAYCFNIQKDVVYPSTKTIQKLIKEMKETDQKLRNIKQELVTWWCDFAQGFREEEWEI